MRRGRIEWKYWLEQGVCGTAALGAFAIGVAGLLGRLFARLAWSDRVPYATLLALSAVLSGMVIDRHFRRGRVEKLLQKTVDTYVAGVQYLEKSSEVVAELERMVRTAHKSILALGAKSTSASYLQRIADRVASEDTTYSRLLTGDHITHELHEHLDALVDLDGVDVAWNPSEKWGNVTISEQQTIWALPSPNPKEFSGVKIPGEHDAWAYAEFFHKAYKDKESIRLETGDHIEVLREDCGKKWARDAKKISNKLAELQAPASTRWLPRWGCGADALGATTPAVCLSPILTIRGRNHHSCYQRASTVASRNSTRQAQGSVSTCNSWRSQTRTQSSPTDMYTMMSRTAAFWLRKRQ